jgi:hypothetical protein
VLPVAIDQTSVEHDEATPVRAADAMLEFEGFSGHGIAPDPGHESLLIDRDPGKRVDVILAAKAIGGSDQLAHPAGQRDPPFWEHHFERPGSAQRLGTGQHVGIPPCLPKRPVEFGDVEQGHENGRPLTELDQSREYSSIELASVTPQASHVSGSARLALESSGDRGIRVGSEFGRCRQVVLLANQFMERPAHHFTKHGIGIGDATLTDHEQARLRLVRQATDLLDRLCDEAPRVWQSD